MATHLRRQRPTEQLVFVAPYIIGDVGKKKNEKSAKREERSQLEEADKFSAVAASVHQICLTNS